jgi:hypothetical protein
MAQFPRARSRSSPTTSARSGLAMPISAACDVDSAFLRLGCGRQIAGALTAIMSGVRYATSAELAHARRRSRLQERTASTCCASFRNSPPRRARRAHRL